MKLNICGDFFPTLCNEELFVKGNIKKLIGGELVDLFRNSDINVCNLEGVLTNCDKGILKSGPHIKASVETIKSFKELGITAVSMANNHIGDYGREGIEQTFKVLKEAGIDYFGAGMDEVSCRRAFIVAKEGVTVGFYSCAEYEFTIAGESYPGANPYDESYIFDDIVALKDKVDYVIVLYHGSKEYYRYPVPYVQKRCRKMIEKGANLVLCQHSHCIGTFEKFKQGEILYGQGDFLFVREDNEFRHSGLLVTVEIDISFKVSYVPIVIKGNGIEIACSKEREKIMTEFLDRSELIKSPNFVKCTYVNFVKKYEKKYYYHFLGRFSIVVKLLIKLGMHNLAKQMFSQRELLALLNDLRCEAHRDLIITSLLADIYGESYIEE